MWAGSAPSSDLCIGNRRDVKEQSSRARQSLNPARDFGPRLWITLVGGGVGSLNSYTWIPIVAPLAGGVAGAFMFDFTIGKVLEAKTLLTSGTAETQGVSVREATHEPTHEPTREPVLER